MKNDVKRGVNLIFSAVIIELISLFMIVGTTFISRLTPWLNFVYVGASLCGGLFLILAAIQYIRGLVIAAKSESSFKFAIFLEVLSLAVTAVASSLKLVDINVKYTNYISSAFTCLITVYILNGISSVFHKNGNEKMAKKGTSTSFIFVLTFICSQLILLFFDNVKITNDKTKILVAVIAVFLYLVLTLIAFLKYLIYLNKSRKLL